MLEQLRLIQRREGLTDGQMAERLGCSRSLWNMVRRERMPLSHEIAVRATGAFPELTRELLDMAVTSATNSPRKAA